MGLADRRFAGLSVLRDLRRIRLGLLLGCGEFEFQGLLLFGQPLQIVGIVVPDFQQRLARLHLFAFSLDVPAANHSGDGRFEGLLTLEGIERQYAPLADRRLLPGQKQHREGCQHEAGRQDPGDQPRQPRGAHQLQS